MRLASGRILFAMMVGLVLCVTIPAKAQGVAEFYKGKTIQIVVGFGVGGGYDLYARALGRYLGRHIPGQPTVVVQNMEGAGSVRAANYVYSGSPKDGTVIAAVNQNAPMYQLLGGAGARFEADGMQWLGGMANANGVVYTWHASGIKTLDDAKRREVPVGAVGTASDSFIFPTIINELLGTKFKPIPGYAGSAQIHLAMERGEVMGRGGNSWASVQTANKNWVTENKINLLVQVGFAKEPELLDVPLLIDLVTSEEAVSIVKVISLPTALGYGHWVAPGVPKDRLEALRAAYVATMKDQEFLKDAEKQNMVIRTQAGAALDALVKQAAAAPKPVLAKTARILHWN
jgi:tripartite-type tricarboxylate transporter receptor subunit TctC